MTIMSALIFFACFRISSAGFPSYTRIEPTRIEHSGLSLA